MYICIAFVQLLCDIICRASVNKDVRWSNYWFREAVWWLYLSLCLSLHSSLYADGIIILASSVAALQRLVNLCEVILQLLELAINIKKSVCNRIGKHVATLLKTNL